MTATARRPLSRQLREAVWAKTLGLCWYCGEGISPDDRAGVRKGNIEHMQPVSRGGGDGLGNLVPEVQRGEGQQDP